MKINFDKRLVRLLEKRKVLTSEDCEKHIAQAAREGLSFSELLTAHNIVPEPTFLSIMASEAKAPPVDLNKITPDEKVVNLFTEDQVKGHKVMPLFKINKVMTIAIANPFDIIMLDDLRRLTGCEIKIVISSEKKILETIQRIYNPQTEEMEKALEESITEDLELTDGAAQAPTDDQELTGEDAPIIKLVNMVIFKGLEQGASDIHIEPFEKKVLVRYRKDGVLHDALTPPKKIFNAMVSRIKIMTSLDIAEKRKPQDGKFQMRYEGRQIDFRVSVLPTIFGEKIVLRVLDSSSITLGLDALGFEPQALDAFRRAVAASYGMILVTGPTGSGKSTTLYSALKEIMSVEDNLMTVEDPVEYQLEGVGQVPVNAKRGLTFAVALRSILRQDPNKVMVGEIRDNETADIAIKAAMTGHLVLSTLHTNDAASATARLIDMGVDSFLVSLSVILIGAQRLARKLCDLCKRPYDKMPSQEKLRSVGFKEEELKDNLVLYRAAGCGRCRDGYKGRFAFLEALEIDDEIRKMIIKKVPTLDLKEYAVKNEGMITLRRCGLLNVMKGKTTIEEVLRMTEL
ncbi:MAG: ATPase, T2SS/T4P/T4SS family [Planctomycetota bacterium]